MPQPLGGFLGLLPRLGTGSTEEDGQSSETKARDFTAIRSSALQGVCRRIFVGPQGIRAGWSAVLFIAIYLLVSAIATAVLGHFVKLELQRPIPPALALLQESSDLLAVFLATLAMARIEHRQILSFGYIDDHKVMQLISGVLWGLLALSALLGISWKAPLTGFDGWSLTGVAAWEYALGWALVFLVVGMFEESLLRGYLQYTLSRGMGFWWAALLLSVTFALWHISNGGESLLGLLVVGLGGFAFCLSLWYTKSLWWAVGFHAGWDWGQSYVYGTPNSGLLTKGHLLSSHPTGNPLWSGGGDRPGGKPIDLACANCNGDRNVDVVGP